MPAAQNSFYGLNANSTAEEHANAFRKAYRLGQAYGYGRTRAKQAARSYKKTQRAYARTKRISAIKSRVSSLINREKKKKAKKSSTIKEKFIREKVIPEKFIREKVVVANSPIAKVKKTVPKQVGKKLSRIAERTHHRKQVGVATGETYLWRMNSNKKRKR